MSEVVPSIRGEFRLHAVLLGGALLAMWVLEVADLFLGGGLDAYGIQPRTVDGLYGIALAPLLHSSTVHLASNTVPFLVFGSLVLMHEVRDFVVTTLLSLLISGLGVWLLGSATTLPVGASGVIFGYLGYLLLRGYFRRSLGSLLLSLLLAFLYGWALWSLLPLQAGVSWEGHLFGFIGGGLSAYLLCRRRPPSKP